MATFRSMVSSHGLMADELPLIHTSRCEHLNSFTSNNALTPLPCDVFHESLVYLFYGRPAYRSTKGVNFGESIALCPVCFVFRPRTVSLSLHRVMPCDSGGVQKPRFEPHLHPNDLGDLELEPVIESARRLVDLVFETNANYFYGKVRSTAIFPDGSLGKRYHELQLQAGPANYDDRKSAIEVQVNQEITLKDQLSFVVLPREFLEEATVKEAILNTWDCEAVEYPTFSGDAPATYYSVVRNEVAKRFETKGRL